MNGEDRNAVMDQITSYDRFASAVTAGSLNRAFAVVVVPPKAPNTQEKWVAVSAVEGVIDPSIQQPDPERKAICGHYEYCLCYWYADELPRCIVLAVVLMHCSVCSYFLHSHNSPRPPLLCANDTQNDQGIKDSANE